MPFNFFKKPSFGLDISDHSIEIIFLKGSLTSPRLFAMGRAVLEPNVVEDGKILDREILQKALKGVVDSPKFGKLTTGNLIFALPESKTFIHIFKLPKEFKKSKERDYIKLQAKETFPYPLDSLYLDFKITIINGAKEVLLAASPKSIVDDYLAMFKNLGLKPLAIGIESESLRNSLARDPGEIVLIADIGAKTTNFSVFDGGNLRFSYTIEIGGNAFSKILVENLKVSFKEAEKTKKKFGLNPNVKEGRIFLIIQKEVQAIIQEIRKVEQYFKEKEGKAFHKIILAGGSAMLPYLSEYLTVNLQKQAIIGGPWSKINIDMLKKREYFEQALEINPILYATCIGSALRGLVGQPETRGINLLAKQLK